MIVRPMKAVVRKVDLRINEVVLGIGIHDITVIKRNGKMVITAVACWAEKWIGPGNLAKHTAYKVGAAVLKDAWKFPGCMHMHTCYSGSEALCQDSLCPVNEEKV